MDESGYGPDRFGLVHADLRLANVQVEDGAPTVIDFDDCGHGRFLWDLASVFRAIEDRPAVGQIIELWMSGHRRILPIPDRGEELLPDPPDPDPPFKAWAGS
jgi:Ser/Thr protein kinase RdoA (MazF antagonist)